MRLNRIQLLKILRLNKMGIELLIFLWAQILPVLQRDIIILEFIHVILEHYILKHYIDRNSYEEIVLKPGDFWIRPAHTLVSWYAEEDTVFTVLSMRYTANFCEGNMLGKTMSINHLIDKKESDISQKKLVNDKLFQLDAIHMGKNSRMELSNNDNLILCSVEGKCALFYHNRQMIIDSQQCFHTNMADKIVLLSATDTKLLLLKFVNQG